MGTKSPSGRCARKYGGLPCGGSFRFTLGVRARERQHGQHAAVVVAALEAELGEDARDVLLPRRVR
jgi:hypothetical protein